jgi:hypothetical protein
MKLPFGLAAFFTFVVFAVSMGVDGQRRNVAPAQVGEFPGPVPVRYESPNKAVIAVIFPVGKPGNKSYESRVELRSNSGKVLAQRDYDSADGQHGYYVQKAAWTPDSKFFVYSMESSGGHQPWHSPVEFYSRSHDKIFSLDDALHDAVTNPQFLVTAPDRVTVELWFSKTTRTVSLSALVPKE